MILEIRKAGFVNKGAELMLLAIMQKIQLRYPSTKIVIAPSHHAGSRPFNKYAPLGIYPKAWVWKFGVPWGDLAVLLPVKLREMYGIVLDKQIDVVLDAAGFSYSDQLGVISSRELVRASKRWRKQGTKVILLPQALGPYQNPKIQLMVKEWAKNTDLIFARESSSYDYLTDIVGKQSKIRLFPDFTNLVNGALPEDYDSSDKRIAMVPNYRMVDRASSEVSATYLSFMIRCTQYLVEQGYKPFILVHEGPSDLMLAKKISEASGRIPIVQETNPIHIKGIIGTCDALIGSRYHSLVSALSQGVPSLATGWSHKYELLFKDYDFNEGILSVLDSNNVLHKKIDMIVNPDYVIPLKKKLIDSSLKLKRKSEEMWDIVFSELDPIYNKNYTRTTT